MITKCSRCGGSKYVKNGVSGGKQRYLCKECKHTFGGGVHSAEKKAFAVQMYMNNVGIRKIGFFLQVSHSLVIKWIKAAHKNMMEALERKRVKRSKVIDEIELDEIFTYVKKNFKEQSYGLLLAENKCVLLHLK
jgi:transposase-like protein